MTDLRGIGMTSQRTRLRLIERLKAQGIVDEQVLEAMTETPRHLFVDEALSHRAYEDTALPIGFNQTLSQPYIVARMTELALQAGRPKRVLELGTGSGYQSAVLSKVADEIYSVERIKPLLDKARGDFANLRREMCAVSTVMALRVGKSLRPLMSFWAPLHLRQYPRICSLSSHRAVYYFACGWRFTEARTDSVNRRRVRRNDY